MKATYFLSLRQLAGRWRLLVILALSALPLIQPLVIVITGNGDDTSARELEEGLINGMLTSAILPLITLTVATAAFGNEVEDRTLSNLTLSAVPRWKIVLPKLLAALTVSVPPIMVTSIASVFIAFEGVGINGAGQAAVAVAVSVSLGAVVYSMVFLWSGLMSARALGFGLLYVFLWEGLFSTFVSGVRYLSIRHYTLTLVNAIDDRRFTGAGQPLIETPAAIVGMIAVFAVFLLLAVRRLRGMDVP